MEAWVARRRRRWQSLKEKLGFGGIGCCGSLWASNPLAPEDYQDSEHDGHDEEHRQGALEQAASSQDAPHPGAFCLEDIVTPRGPAPAAAEEMNLAAALAAERQLRTTAGVQQGWEGSGTPARVSLMMLLEEGDEREREREEAGWWCCVCMGRRKGAAFIPCGHAFCRVCARELWINRGTCPLCNRPILEILDIF